ncbi:HEAT repeat domain-containing protein [bacterium]|nr:HEAT repeat domain-containing protein [bacterium]
MKLVFRVFVFFIMSLFLMVNFLNAAGKIETLFKKAEGLYSKGNIEEAIILLEKAFVLDKKDKKTKTLLVQILKESGDKCLNEGNDLKALMFFKKIGELQPQNEEIQHLSWSIEDKITLPVFAVHFQNTSDKMIMAFVKNLQKLMIINGGIVIGALFVGGIFLILFLSGGNKKREQIMIEEWRKLRVNLHSKEEFYKKQQEQMLRMIQEENMLVSEASARLATKQSFTIKEMIADGNPYIRARGVEVLGEELKIEKDNTIVEKLLIPFLKDKNNRVRGNAAKALYPHNKELALKSLKEMSQTKDPWMRASAAWALGEIGGQEATKILLTLLEDSDYNVQKRVLKSLVIARTKKGKSNENGNEQGKKENN